MRGNNELRLNQATMIEALQQYLNAQMTSAQKVVSIEQDSRPNGGTFDGFVVKLTDHDPTGVTA